MSAPERRRRPQRRADGRDGSEPDTIRGILGAAMDGCRHAELIAAKVFESAGTYAPMMGISGAVMGLMAAMEHLSDPSKLGPGIAGAFVSTVYRVGESPAAAAREQVEENPRHIEAKLQGFRGAADAPAVATSTTPAGSGPTSHAVGAP